MPTIKPPLKEAELVTFTGDFLTTLQTKPAGTFPVDAALSRPHSCPRIEH